jgi:hypothetical protein
MHNVFGFKMIHTSFPRILGFTCILLLIVIKTGCTKQPASNQANEAASPSANANQGAQSSTAPLYAQENLKGDIERISLAISMAKESATQNKWQEAASRLRGVKSLIDTALSRKPRLQDEFEGLKLAIDRALPLVENGAKEADAKITELQTRIGAIKTNTY